MLKRRLTPNEWGELVEAVQALYEEKSGTYYLSLEPENGDVGGLKRALEHEREERRKLAAEKRQAEEKAREDAGKAAKAAGDIEALEKSWQEKLDASVASVTADADRYLGALKQSHVANIATGIANEISTVPGLLAPVIRQRLVMEILSDGTPITRVLDSEGKPSAMSLTELKEWYKAQSEYATIIKGSDASGGGASNGSSGGAAGKKFNEMSPAALSELRRSNPEEYARLKRERDASRS